MRVFKRVRNGVESSHYYIKIRVNGKQILKNTGCTTQKTAEVWARTYAGELLQQSNAEGLAETIRRIKTGGRTIPVAEGAARYLAKPLRRPPARAHASLIVNRWADFAAFAERRGESHLAEVSHETAEAYVQFLRSPARGLSARSANCYTGICKQVIKALMREAGMAENPFDEIRPVKGEARRRHAFSRPEVAAIIAAADDFVAPLVTLAICTGMREGDCCRLLWREVDLRTGWITRTMSKTGGAVRCPITATLRELLERLPRTGPHVLPAQAEMYQGNPSGISWRVKKAIKASGVLPEEDDDLIRDFHSLRHSFVWMAAEAGVPMPVVQAMVGHMTPAMTRMYADHATDTAITAAVARMGDPLTGVVENPLAAFTTQQLQDELMRRSLANKQRG